MSDTPNPDSVISEWDAHDKNPAADLARQLYRELTAAQAEIARLTRERDVFAMQANTLAVKVDQLTANLNQSMLELDQALMLLGVYKTKSGDLLARVQRLEEAGRALADSFPRTHPQHDELMNQWSKAKEATP